MSSESSNRIGTGWHIVAAASFLPGIGLVFGLAAIAAGITKRRAGGMSIVVVAVSGMVFWGALLGLSFLVQRGHFLSQERRLTTIQLAGVIHAIEFHRTKTGSYPESLEDIDVSSPLFAFDAGPGGGPQPFHYELRDGGRRYTVFAFGPDGTAGTDDDVLPELDPNDLGGLGFEFP